jgi:hypothetical protein
MGRGVKPDLTGMKGIKRMETNRYNNIADGCKVIKQNGNKKEIDTLVAAGWWVWRRQKSKYDGMFYVTLLPGPSPVLSPTSPLSLLNKP